ncbi:MAG: hypothetical protein AAGF31_11140, partial [Planctomycetota bacterium]
AMQHDCRTAALTALSPALVMLAFATTASSQNSESFTESDDPASRAAVASRVFLQEMAGEKPKPSNPLELPDFREVYSNDFIVEAGDQWGNARLSLTPVDKRPCLGFYGSESVQFSAKRLPDHQLLFISFDLFLRGTWDGSSNYWGPDLWELSLIDGRRLMRTSFSNCKPVRNDEQSYPDDYPCPPHAGWTGASEFATLGYPHSFARSLKNPWLDSVYSIAVAVPHISGRLHLSMTGLYSDPLSDQAWAVANFRVAVASRRPLEHGEGELLWRQLGDDDPVRANAALWRLASAGDQAIRVAREQLESMAGGASLDTLLLGPSQRWQIRRARRLARVVGGSESQALLAQLASLDTADEDFLPN